LEEIDCIELVFENQVKICKPSYLQFVSFQTEEKWFYFRLETNILQPMYTECTYENFYEYLIELDNGEIVSHSRENDDYVIKHFKRYISRILSGSMVIVAKSSMYNHDAGTYDGRHNKMSSEEFRKYIEESIIHIT
jgi:serine/threonine-protein kinase